ncbi:hypothetical protein ABTX81_28035 [Kitasatospora sp. NPDC097605]|uniref:hypothetical protein n=1 Tax=Kitasatospora sp. NPDC097605 TaxID=3157226 RepID=UPI003325514B
MRILKAGCLALLALVLAAVVAVVVFAHRRDVASERERHRAERELRATAVRFAEDVRAAFDGGGRTEKEIGELGRGREVWEVRLREEGGRVVVFFRMARDVPQSGLRPGLFNVSICYWDDLGAGPGGVVGSVREVPCWEGPNGPLPTGPVTVPR